MYQNKVTLIGFLSNDADVRSYDNRSFTALSLETQSSYKKDGRYASHTEWHRCVIFGKKLAEFAATLRRALISRSKASCAAASTTARRLVRSRPCGRSGWTRLSSCAGLAANRSSVARLCCVRCCGSASAGSRVVAKGPTKVEFSDHDMMFSFESWAQNYIISPAKTSLSFRNISSSCTGRRCPIPQTADCLSV